LIDRDVIKLVKSIFASPVGTIPRGGIETSLQVRFVSSPSKITLINKRRVEFSIAEEDGIWIVNGTSRHDNLRDSLVDLTNSIVLDEIDSKF